MAGTVPSASRLSDEGEPFGPFVLVRRLGEGGMAETFLAERRAPCSDPSRASVPFGRQVCLKLILPEHSRDAEFKGWFLEEARIHAQLHHDNIVQVYDFGELDGRTYLVLEYVEGCDLRDLMLWLRSQGRLLPTPLVVALVHELASALDYAHRLTIRGEPQLLVHRDVSPHNVLLSVHGHGKLCDFGVAKAQNRAMRTETGGTKGKIPYMSPEQLTAPERVDARTDLFALGVVLFELLTGAHPYRPNGTETDMDVARRILHGTRARVRDLVPEAPGSLANIVEQLLAIEPEQRVPSATHLLKLLESASDAPTPAAARKLAGYVRAAAGGEPLSDTHRVVAPFRGRSQGARGRAVDRYALLALAAACALATAVAAATFVLRAPAREVPSTRAVATAPPELPRVASVALPVPPSPAPSPVSEPAPVQQPSMPETGDPAKRSAQPRARALLPSAQKSNATEQLLDAWLDISVQPDGLTWRVWVDGQYQGTANVKVKVAAGKHRVAVGVEHPQRERTVRVSAQSTRTLYFKSS